MITAKTSLRKIGLTSKPYSKVLRVIQDDETRLRLTTVFRGAGFTANDVEHSRKAREALVESVIRTEDWLENEHPGRKTEREAIKIVRRRLEAELWA